MMFVMKFLIYLIVCSLSTTHIFSQGVFDPAAFNGGLCSGSNRWTMWFDSNKPNLAQGEYEVTMTIGKLFPSFMCPNPIAIEARTLDDRSPASTGDLFRVSTADGFLCLNQQIPQFKEKFCADYKVRFCCPNSSIGQQVTSTPRPSVVTTLPSTINRGCGRQAIAPSTQRIVGGSEAVPNSWPWLISLQYGDHFCGGTLIDTRHVVTAAHCLGSTASSQLRVVAGLHQRTNKNTGRVQTISVSRIFIHEYYSASSQSHDIAVVRLAQPVTLNDYVNVICLPGPDPQEYASVTVAGWGALRYTGSSSNSLQQVTLKVINNEATAAYSSYFNVQRQIGAGIPREGGKDSCQGDSGGPLMFKSNDAWYLSGVVSFGNGCARPLNPGIYTRTSAYVSWIQSKVNAK